MGVNRKKIAKAPKPRVNNFAAKRKQYKERAIEFLKNGENSYELPGKRDVEKGVTRYALCDTIDNLHRKFLAANPDIKMGLSTFMALRPSYIKLIICTNRISCLCLKCENARLKLVALHSGTTSTRRVLEDNTDAEIVEKFKAHFQSSPTITFNEWEKTEIEHNGKILKKTRFVRNIAMEEDEFVEKVEREFVELREHKEIYTNQHEQVRHLREVLPLEEVSIHMDYAENYNLSLIHI